MVLFWNARKFLIKVIEQVGSSCLLRFSALG